MMAENDRKAAELKTPEFKISEVRITPQEFIILFHHPVWNTLSVAVNKNDAINQHVIENAPGKSIALTTDNVCGLRGECKVTGIRIDGFPVFDAHEDSQPCRVIRITGETCAQSTIGFSDLALR